MIRSSNKPKDPDIVGSFTALRRAARRAREIGRRTGTPVYVMERGRIVDILAEERKRQKAKRRRK